MTPQVSGHDTTFGWARVLAVARRDLASTLRNKGVRIPLLIAPTVILVVLPILLVTGGNLLAASTTGQFGQITASSLGSQVAPDAATSVTGYTGAAAWPTFVLQVLIAPLYLLVPLMVATVIAADSFAGERDRGTLEALLHTPTSDRELFVGKFMSSWIPAMVVSMVGLAVYSLLANLLAWPYIGEVFFPTPEWWVLGLVVTPGLAAVGLGLMVVVSSRVQSLQAAHQFGSLVVLPVIVLLIAQVSGTLLFDLRFVALLALTTWLAAALLLRVAGRTFTRDRLATRL